MDNVQGLQAWLGKCEHLRGRAAVQPLLRAASQAGPALTELVCALSAIPAPTFEEEARGAYAARFLEQVTGVKAARDHAGNRWIALDGCGVDTKKSGPRLLFSAHLDTVFPRSTTLTLGKKNGRLYLPGISDNGAGLAVLLTAAKLLSAHQCPFAGRWIFAVNTAEEGLGDLRGMRALCDRFGPEIDGALALDGNLGSIVGTAVGSRRYRISVKGPGGHSWTDFGRPSATHQLARIATSLSALTLPEGPRSTFNIGQMQGGTSVNSIAAEAELLLDLRSTEPFALERLDAAARQAVESIPAAPELHTQLEVIGERPAGDPGLTREWTLLSQAACLQLGLPHTVTASSTDANIPLSRGLRASTLGICRGGGAHTLEEWLEPESMVQGLELFLWCALLRAE